mmetsp:Transcript_39817/g.89201  ORF Transcript_39817/g.89201 Transcript_39817/m.89201 type:complete len:211 (-) Transcript_39817:2673-3305(-)
MRPRSASTATSSSSSPPTRGRCSTKTSTAPPSSSKYWTKPTNGWALRTVLRAVLLRGPRYRRAIKPRPRPPTLRARTRTASKLTSLLKRPRMSPTPKVSLTWARPKQQPRRRVQPAEKAGRLTGRATEALNRTTRRKEAASKRPIKRAKVLIPGTAMTFRGSLRLPCHRSRIAETMPTLEHKANKAMSPKASPVPLLRPRTSKSPREKLG